MASTFIARAHYELNRFSCPTIPSAEVWNTPLWFYKGKTPAFIFQDRIAVWMAVGGRGGLANSFSKQKQKICAIVSQKSQLPLEQISVEPLRRWR